jgi:hypothetical protein
MLFVVGAEAAIVGASPLNRSVVDERHLGGLDEDLAAAAVIVDVVGDENSFRAMLGAAFQEKHISVLEYRLRFNLAVTGRTDRESDVVEEVGTGFRHGTASALGAYLI